MRKNKRLERDRPALKKYELWNVECGSFFRRLKGAELLPVVYASEQYVDGMKRPGSLRQRLAS